MPLSNTQMRDMQSLLHPFTNLKLLDETGPNIIEQTIRQKLPPGFQRSEFLLQHGAIDMIVHRRDMRDTVARLLAKLTRRSGAV